MGKTGEKGKWRRVKRRKKRVGAWLRRRKEGTGTWARRGKKGYTSKTKERERRGEVDSTVSDFPYSRRTRYGELHLPRTQYSPGERQGNISMMIKNIDQDEK